MPRLIPAYYLALSAGNIAFVAFATSKLAAPVAPAVRRKRGRILTSITNMRKVGQGPFPKGGHAES